MKKKLTGEMLRRERLQKRVALAVSRGQLQRRLGRMIARIAVRQQKLDAALALARRRKG